MSSSVFAKSPVSTNESRIESNLVVVYGKNGINVDCKELENLIDEKSHSTISVIRLTSPTPSMEEENEKKDEKKSRKSVKNKDEDDKSVEDTEDDEIKDENDEDIENGEEEDTSVDEDDEDEFVSKNKRHKRYVKPENVGLTVEKFYLPDEAKKIAKDILSISGINRLLVNVDFDLQRLGIENDHCYTPLTSPNSNKKKLEKQESVQKLPSTSKLNNQAGNRASAIKKTSSIESSEEKSIDNKPNQEIDDEFEDDDTDYEIESLDTDNDRDSDLDFSVFDRNGRRQRKKSTKKHKRSSVLTKVPKKRRSIQIDQNSSQEYDEKKSTSRNEAKIISRSNSMHIVEQQSTTISKPTKYLITNPHKANVISNSQISKEKIEKQLPVQNKLPTNVQSGKIVVQDAVIKPPAKIKVNSSSGAFTDISKFLQKNETNKSNIKVSELVKPDLKNPHVVVNRAQVSVQDQTKFSKKVFMPIDMLVKNQLPSHISIETNQSQSDLLAAEDDKQLDLIDSILKKEMEKSNVIDKDSMKKNDNIPKLVKMLESTEKTVFAQQQMSNIHQMAMSVPVENQSVATFTNSVEDIDIANAPLLESQEEIPEDLLKDVSELIDNKTLQEFVEKQNLLQQQQQQQHQQQQQQQLSQHIPIVGMVGTGYDAKASVLVNTPNEQHDIISANILENKTNKQINNIVSSTPNRSEYIQIVQRNGKVITLPPIEAPTTRAKRRAAAQSTHDISLNVSVISEDGNTSQKQSANSSGSSSRRNSKDQGKSTESTKKQRTSSLSQNNDESADNSGQEDDDDDPNKLWCICRQPHNNRFMICCDVCEDWFHGSCVNITKAMGAAMEQKGTEWTCPKCLKNKKPTQKKITDLFEKKPSLQKKTSFSEGQDAKKLLSPHQKPVATETKKKVNKRSSIELMSNTSTGNDLSRVCKTNEIMGASTTLHGTETPIKTVRPTEEIDIANKSISKEEISSEIEDTLHCIVCKKLARSNSIYCSDECIRKHAYNALVTKVSKVPSTQSTGSPTGHSVSVSKKNPSSFEEALAIASDLHPKKAERVYVYERKSGRILTGSNAPTTSNLKKWLQDNPTFEVVQTGSPQSLAIETRLKNKQLQKQHSSETSTSIVHDSFITTQPTIIKVIKSPTLIKMNKTEMKNVPQIPNQSQTQILKPVRKASSSNEQKSHHQKQQQSQPKKSEPIRLNVKRTLKEQLTLRMNELKDGDDHATLRAEEIESFAKKTEEEMFKLFNKDTGTKYKAKYRSLSFNLKDRKNKTLFKKICEKLIEPYDLVRMSPEQLASQELAQWRQNENKHQLEMIKKSELDLLSCAKNYVLKTHKGEEVIESKITDRLNLDITIPVEDVVTVLNNSTVSSTSELDQSSLSVKDPLKISSGLDQSADHKINSSGNKTHSEAKSGHKKSRSRDHDKHHKTKTHRHKEKSSSRRSRSRSRDRSKHNKSPYKDDKHDSTKRKEQPKFHDSKQLLSNKSSSINLKHSSSKTTSHKPVKEDSKLKTEIPQSYSLIDQILESSKTVEEAANLKRHESDKKNLTSTVATIPQNSADQQSLDKKNTDIQNESDEEPTSTVVISTPPQEDEELDKYSREFDDVIWTGSINMIDVATFQISILPLSGMIKDLDNDLPAELDVVGRIGPDTVWDYISKIKQSPNKEVVLVRLVPFSETENIAYTALYMYLDKRRRLGVVKTISPAIKDFYILPLEGTKMLPSILQPVTNSQFFEDESRPDLLIGIVIRIMGVPKRTFESAALKKTATTVIPKKTITAIDLDEDHYTPPGSPSITAKKTLSRLPKTLTDSTLLDSVKETAETTLFDNKGYDADEPYSPGGSIDDEELIPLITPTSSTLTEQNELKRKMDEINRQIEAQQQEIAGMLGTDAYSPTDSTASSSNLPQTLANISIPSNLQQILASIQSKPATESQLVKSIDSEEKIAASLPDESVFKSSMSNSSTSRLAQLSEAELLSMVPDDVEINTKTKETLNIQPPPLKKPRWDIEPPPPGLEDEFH